jgi:hypothetical protein
MNMLAVQAEMAMWLEGLEHPLLTGQAEDIGVADSVINEFPERMGDLANYMAKIYGGPIVDYLKDIEWSFGSRWRRI